MNDKYFTGIYIRECANGFMLEEGGDEGVYCMGSRWAFNSRQDLANWILSSMKQAGFEKTTKVTIGHGGTLTQT